MEQDASTPWGKGRQLKWQQLQTNRVWSQLSHRGGSGAQSSGGFIGVQISAGVGWGREPVEATYWPGKKEGFEASGYCEGVLGGLRWVREQRGLGSLWHITHPYLYTARLSASSWAWGSMGALGTGVLAAAAGAEMWTAWALEGAGAVAVICRGKKGSE